MSERVNKYREFTVTPGVCGFKVKIGCSEVYFNDAKAAAKAISDYLTDPQKTEKEYLAKDCRFTETAVGIGTTMTWAVSPVQGNTQQAL